MNSLNSLPPPANDNADACAPPVRAAIPWQRSPLFAHAKELYRLADAYASNMPKKRHTLGQRIEWAVNRLLRNVGLATCESDARRVKTHMRDALRAAHDAAIWLDACIEEAIEPSRPRDGAWRALIDLCSRLSGWLERDGAPCDNALAASRLGRPRNPESACSAPPQPATVAPGPPQPEHPPEPRTAKRRATARDRSRSGTTGKASRSKRAPKARPRSKKAAAKTRSKPLAGKRPRAPQ